MSVAGADTPEEHAGAPTEREGLSRWVEDWRQDHRSSPIVTTVIDDALARYLAHLRASGSSSRSLSCLCSNLNAAGHLVLMHDAPKNGRLLEHFTLPPWELEFKRKFSDSLTRVARYRRSLEGFAKHLKECDVLPRDGG